MRRGTFFSVSAIITTAVSLMVPRAVHFTTFIFRRFSVRYDT